ncbi:TldD/PmbA family protein [bacterium]|nr:TldD/PmbA family protein [candidate division CSSED10-310 bacterium]
MKKKQKQLLDLAESLVSYGRKKGADEVQVRVSDGSDFSVDVREGKIEKLEEASERDLSLKVIVDQKTASATSSDLTKETLHHLVDNGIARARVSSADPFAGLPEKEEVQVKAEDLRIYDPKIIELSPEKKIEAAKQTEAICLTEKRVRKSHGAGFGTYHGTLALANSNGFSGVYDRTSCSCGVYLQSGEGDNLFDDGWDDFSRNLDDLLSPEAIAQKAVHRVTRLIGARKIETQKVPVVLEPYMTGSILRFLYDCVKGSNIYMKRSFLVDKLGETVGNEHINVIDNGLIPGGPSSKPFDREGVPVRKTVVFEKGVLKSYLLDTYSARKLNLKSTGNRAGANNLYLESGNDTPEAIIKSVDKGLLLVDTIGQGEETTSGDISKGAFGLWIENGELVYPVAEITISGNLGEMLKQIEMVGNDLEFKRSITGPTIKISEMTIGGK